MILDAVKYLCGSYNGTLLENSSYNDRIMICLLCVLKL